MATPKHEFVPYAPLPQTTVVLVPYYRPPPSFLRRRRLFAAASIFLLLAGAAVLFYPSDPRLSLARISLNRVGIRTSPELTLDLSFSLTLRVFNRDFFSLRYRSLVASVAYRGRELGVVTSDGGDIRARGSSYVNATLDLDGLRMVEDAFFLIGDWARGVIPFVADSTIEGDLGLLLFEVPIKTTISCEVYVDRINQKIEHQDCYPK